MKRFLVFSDTEYCKGGGWIDFEKSFQSLDEALKFAKQQPRGLGPDDRERDGWHIVDLATETVVAKGEL